MKPLPTQARIQELLHYCPTTGEFRWKSRQGNTRHDRMFNSKHAGDIAGRLNERGYYVIPIDGEKFQAHRLAWVYVTGQQPTGIVDHGNGETADNRWSNLRLATPTQNRANSAANNSTGLKGVKRHHNKFLAYAGPFGTNRYLGSFDTAEEAHQAYQRRALELYGEYASAAR